MTAVTYDEQQLIAIHNAGTRTDTISALKEMREYISAEETELKAITDSAISRLEEMTDEDFEKLDLTPDFIIEEEYEFPQIDPHFAEMKLIEILHERGLINEPTYRNILKEERKSQKKKTEGENNEK